MSRFKQYLIEKFTAGAFTGRGLNKKYVEIFENPSRREIEVAARSVSGMYDIRFMADSKKKKVWVWNAYLLHTNAWDAIREETGDKRKIYTTTGLLAGVAEKISGEWVMDFFTKRIEFNRKEWKWLERYIKMGIKEDPWADTLGQPFPKGKPKGGYPF